MAGGVAFNDLHKLFLQGLMSTAILTKEKSLRLLKGAVKLSGFQTPVTDDDVSIMIQEINVKINNFGQEIKEIKSEINGEDFIVLINVIDDSSVLEKIDHVYSVKEREVFRLFLEAVVRDEPYGNLSTMDALNLHIPNMRPGEIQDLIEKLVTDQWFVEMNGGWLVPGPRCIAEFDTYLKKNFHDYVQICKLCSNVVFYGVQCLGCDNITHKHCFLHFNKRKNGKGGGANKCPVCKEPIGAATGAAEDPHGQDEDATPQPRKRGRTQEARNVTSPDTPENTPGPSHGGDTPGPSQIYRPGPASARNRRKRQNPE